MCFRPAEASLNDHNICDACGIENPPGEEICSNCGAKLVKKTIGGTKPSGTAGGPPAAPSIPSAPPIPGPPKAPKVDIPKLNKTDN